MKKEIKINNECLNPNNIDFQIIRPGGNDTALVEGIILDDEKRGEVNDQIMETFGNVEQVGFWERKSENKIELMMAGGEFCGNATRSSAWLSLGGGEGNVQVDVLGVGVSLEAGVNGDGEAWAQMPIYPEIDKVQFLDNGMTIVEMQGITQVALDVNEAMSEEAYKESAKEILEDLDLLQTRSASGVMFLERDGDDIKMNPVVWVRDIETYFYETACGSGTTAVGMVEALKNGSSIQRQVIQPTGSAISVSVGFDGEKFTRVEISGLVKDLGKERVEI